MLLLLFCSNFSFAADKINKDETYLEHEYSDALAEARKQARATLPKFLDRYRAQRPGDAHFSLKIEIEDDNGIESLWVSNFKIKGDVFTGYISNPPQVVKVVQQGQTIEFSHDIISDWTFVEHGVMQGNFSLRVLLKDMPEADAKRIRKQIGWK